MKQIETPVGALGVRGRTGDFLQLTKGKGRVLNRGDRLEVSCVGGGQDADERAGRL